MKKKILEASIACLFVLFSFYYTEKAIHIVEQKDPIMKQILKEKEKKEETSVDAVLNDQFLLPGYNGYMVDVEASFSKMKRYGSYNENLYVFEEVEPTISIEDYYDKYISSGNGLTNTIAFIFVIKEGMEVDEIKTVLDQNNVRGTFFVDGVWLEQKKDEVYQLVDDFHEVEILSYDGGYDPLLFTGVLDQLQLLTNQKGKYCYAEYDQKEILELCEKEKMHTIIPTLRVEKNFYQTVKGKVGAGYIIEVENTKENRKELGVVINYLKQRGYQLDTLDHLLSEARDFEK
ncbi:MAG TPA: hypothetical protein IAC24_01515 [Candidatus Onthousia faecigallinarum]|nr:hypothetical protein [Candidatus Onthousia faecigallinarum]